MIISLSYYYYSDNVYFTKSWSKSVLQKRCPHWHCGFVKLCSQSTQSPFIGVHVSKDIDLIQHPPRPSQVQVNLAKVSSHTVVALRQELCLYLFYITLCQQTRTCGYSSGTRSSTCSFTWKTVYGRACY